MGGRNGSNKNAARESAGLSTQFHKFHAVFRK
jgi:hypothetical protein